MYSVDRMYRIKLLASNLIADGHLEDDVMYGLRDGVLGHSPLVRRSDIQRESHMLQQATCHYALSHLKRVFLCPVCLSGSLTGSDEESGIHVQGATTFNGGLMSSTLFIWGTL